MKKILIILFGLVVIGGVYTWINYDDLKDDEIFNKILLKDKYTYKIANAYNSPLNNTRKDKECIVFERNDIDAYKRAYESLSVAILSIKIEEKTSNEIGVDFGSDFNIDNIFLVGVYKNGKNVLIPEEEEKEIVEHNNKLLKEALSELKESYEAQEKFKKGE